MAAALESQDTELDDLDKRIAAIGDVLNDQTVINAANRSQFIDLTEANASLLARIEALEQSTIKRPPTRKVTRQAKPTKQATKSTK